MKSPLPTSFALLLAAAAVLVGTAFLRLFSGGLEFPRGVYAGLGLLQLCAILHMILGVVAGLKYRQDRKALNWVGLCGNGLLLIGYLTFSVFTYRQIQAYRASRRLGGPVEVVK